MRNSKERKGDTLKITNKDKFGNTLDVTQMIRLWKKDIEKADLMYELKRREVFLSKPLKEKMKSEHHQRMLRKKK